MEINKNKNSNTDIDLEQRLRKLPLDVLKKIFKKQKILANLKIPAEENEFNQKLKEKKKKYLNLQNTETLFY